MSDADAGVGLSAAAVDPLRYDSHDLSSHEVGGIVLSHLPSGARVLDIGCGTGALATLMRDLGAAQVIGIEPHAVRAAAARDRGLHVLEREFSPSVVEEYGRFDVVVLADVLEHLPDPAKLLLEVRTALAPEGIVLASVPNVAHWSVRRSLAGGRFEYEPFGIMDATHLRWFTRQTFGRLFATTGFEVLDLVPTAGVALPVYGRERPWRWLTTYRRRQLLARLLQISPTLFACQFVAAARPVGQAPKADS